MLRIATGANATGAPAPLFSARSLACPFAVLHASFSHRVPNLSTDINFVTARLFLSVFQVPAAPSQHAPSSHTQATYPPPGTFCHSWPYYIANFCDLAPMI